MERSNLGNLPDELSLNMFDFFDDKALRTSESVNKNWNRVLRDEIFWEKKIISKYGLDITFLKPPHMLYHEQYRQLVNADLNNAINLERLDLFAVALDMQKESLDEEYIDDIMNELGERGMDKFLEWAMKEGYVIDEIVANGAAMYGHVHTLKLLQTHGIEADEDGMTHALNNDHIDVVQWMLEEGFSVDDRQYIIVLINGNIRMVRLFYQYDIVPSNEIMEEVYNRTDKNTYMRISDLIEELFGIRFDP